MTGIVRFVVRVDATWKVTISCPAHDDAWAELWESPPRVMSRVESELGAFPSPDLALHDPAVLHDQLTAPTDGGAAVAAAYGALISMGEAPVDQFGHYLFDALLGEDLWNAMTVLTETSGGETLELALALPPDDAALQRLNWEMMRNRFYFLAAGTPSLKVAITRLVDGPPGLVGRPIGAPPKVLFVVGTDLDDKSVRPGAELVGLLRRSKSTDARSINHRLLEQAKPNQIRETVRTFKPDIVHFICHGGVDGGRPYLELKTDDNDASPNRSTEQLLSYLRDGKRLPAIVVLSACHTAGQQDDAFPASTKDVASMAEGSFVSASTSSKKST